MDAERIEKALLGLLDEISSFDAEDLRDFSDATEAFKGCRPETFENAGILTTNRGLVLRLRDGSEFQIEILRSR